MATELRRQGERVELLAMMDSPLPALLAALPVPDVAEAERQVAAILRGDGSEVPVDDTDVRAMARVFANNLRVSGASSSVGSTATCSSSPPTGPAPYPRGCLRPPGPSRSPGSGSGTSRAPSTTTDCPAATTR